MQRQTLETLLKYRDYAQNQLDEFIANYHGMGDPELFKKSEAIFNNLRGFFALQDLIAKKTVSDDEGFRTRYIPYFEVREDIERIAELATMMHVDEPADEYLEQLKRVRDRFQIFDSAEFTNLFTELVNHLTDEDETALESDIAKRSDFHIPTEVGINPAWSEV